MKYGFYRGPPVGFFDPKRFKTYISGVFKDQAGGNGAIDVIVNEEVVGTTTVFHVLPYGVGVAYSYVHKQGVQIILLAHNAHNLSRISTILKKSALEEALKN